MKIEMDYDPATGALTNPSDSLYIATVLGLDVTPVRPPEADVVDAKKLTAQEVSGLHETGLTSVEIISLRREGVMELSAEESVLYILIEPYKTASTDYTPIPHREARAILRRWDEARCAYTRSIGGTP